MAVLCLQVVVGQGEAPEMGLRYKGKYNGNHWILLYSVILNIVNHPLLQITCISCKFSNSKIEAISANCDFIVFTAELLQYSTESHEIKVLWKTRQKNSQNCCMAATASSLPQAIQRPLTNYSSISWFLVAFCKAKIAWFAVNTEHSTNCWENTREAGSASGTCFVTGCSCSASLPDRKWGDSTTLHVPS